LRARRGKPTLVASDEGRFSMTQIKYEVVEHDGGFAYKLGDVFSEPFPTHDEALAAARRAAIEQRMSGETAAISWQDAAA
jgi:hypothetical protein